MIRDKEQPSHYWHPFKPRVAAVLFKTNTNILILRYNGEIENNALIINK